MSTESKKVIITGGSGFLGTHLTGWLLDRDYTVVSLDVVPPKDDRVTFVQKDILSDDLTDDRLKDSYAIINLAGKSIFGRWTQSFKQVVYDTRVRGTENIVSLFVHDEFRPQVFVSASAAGFYGDQGNKVLTAESGPGSGFLATVSLDWEQAALTAENYGVPTTIIRNGHILGDGGLLRVLLPYYRWGLGGPLGSGRQWFPWIHIDDITRMYVRALQTNGSVDTVNACSPHQVRNK